MRALVMMGTAAGYLAAVAAGCHLAAGLDGVEFEGNGGGPGSGGAGAHEGGGGPGGSEGGSGATGGSTSNGGAGGSGGQSTEDCTNGVDDDGDDLVDCEDDGCTPAFLCVPNAPTDWLGPVASFNGATAPTACPSDYDSIAYDGVSGLQFDAATCNACSCTAPNAVCNPAALQEWNNSGCSGSPIAANQASCNDYGPTPRPLVYLRAGPPTAAAGTGGCVESGGGVADAPAPTFDTQARLCAVTSATGAGCLSDQACMPAVGSSSYEQKHCIYRAGDHACPPPYTEQRQHFDGTPPLDDTRDCSACSCPFTGSCTGFTQFHGSAACMDFMPPVMNNDGTGCTELPSSERAVRFTFNNLTASCPATGGATTGDVTVNAAATITTVCCMP